MKKNIFNVCLLLLLGTLLTACGNPRDEQFWLSEKNYPYVESAHRVCTTSSYSPRIASLDPKFTKDECPLVEKVWPKAKEMQAEHKLSELISNGSTYELYKAWKPCATQNYLDSDKKLCGKITPAYLAKAKETIPGVENWDINKISSERSRCIQDAELGEALMSKSRKNYCASFHIILDQYLQKTQGDKIQAWKETIDKYKSMPDSEFYALTDSPCGILNAGTEGASTKMRMRVSTRYITWDKCNAFTRVYDSRQ